MYSEFKAMAFKGDLEALILGVLDTGELHGYAIAKRIQDQSDKALEVGEGQLYPTLHILERAGMVSAVWVPQEAKPPRKVYRITEDGKAALAGKRKEWTRFTDAVGAILNSRGTAPSHFGPVSLTHEASRG